MGEGIGAFFFDDFSEYYKIPQLNSQQASPSSFMASDTLKSVRFHDDLGIDKPVPSENGSDLGLIEEACQNQIHKSYLKKAGENTYGKPLHQKELSRVFSEDYEAANKKILDPRGSVINRWNKIFLVSCLISLFVDPLFFYLPGTKEGMCMDMSQSLEIALTVIRSAVDAFYMIHIFVRFRTAYVAPSSRVFGRGELVIDPSKIATRYLRKAFLLDLVAAVPLPQMLIWAVIPNLWTLRRMNLRLVLRLIIIFQYLLRLYLIFPLSSQMVKTTGVMTETAWAGAAYNLVLYMLASHVLGSCWYLLSTERQEECWRKVCSLQESDYCNYWFLDCNSLQDPARAAWFRSSNISTLCSPSGKFVHFGIYADALTSGVASLKFFNKFSYCLWWGLRNLSSLGQNLSTSTYVGEINFAIVIAILGLVLFALLIGNMQTYLQSTTVRLEEWRIRMADTKQWMHHRQLPRELQQSIRRYNQYSWIANSGVDEEAILKSLPLDLRRDIKRHLCLDLVLRVPLFAQMDERMLDVICERLKPGLCTPGTCLVREGDPVSEMLFIIRGHLDSYTTNGGRTGFFNSCRIGPTDFCGEELLTWALDPRPSVILPSSTRTAIALTEVETFALIADDLKFVASQFRRLHSKQLRHTLRFYSHQWRTWAACFIQAAWFRYKKRREASELKAVEGSAAPGTDRGMEQKGAGLAVYAVKLAGSIRRGGSDLDIRSLQKPTEPDFTVDDR